MVIYIILLSIVLVFKRTKAVFYLTYLPFTEIKNLHLTFFTALGSFELEKKLSDVSIANRIIFDGFPRNIEQAKTLDSLLSKYSQSISLVLNLKVDYSVLTKRISGRVSCSVCKRTFNEFFDPPVPCENSKCSDRVLNKRSDDNVETVSKRLKTYDESTLPILGYYSSKNIVKDVDAMQDIGSVSKQISSIIKDLKR